jgi:hypothetical protein
MNYNLHNKVTDVSRCADHFSHAVSIFTNGRYLKTLAITTLSHSIKLKTQFVGFIQSPLAKLKL